MIRGADGEDQPSLKIYCLGLPVIELAGQTVSLVRRKALALLAYLVVEGAPVGREALATLLSPNHDGARAYAELRRALAELKSAGMGEWLVADRAAISVRREGCWADVWALGALQAAETPDALEAAAALFRGELLQGLYLRDNAEFEEWRSLQAQLYLQRRISVLERLIDAHLTAGQIDPALNAVRRLLDVDPFNEYEQQRAMSLLTASGQRAAALKQYEHLTERLMDEIGAAPHPETTRLYEAIKAQQPVTLAEPGGGSLAAANLPPGNLPPRPILVVGREHVLDEIRAMIGAGADGGEAPIQSPIVIQGWPGIGKSTMMGLLAHDAETRRRFPDGVLWASLGQHPNVLSALRTWASILGVSLPAEMDTPEKVSSLLAGLLKTRRMLLLVDDLWESSLFTLFNMGGEQCAMVVSSRLNQVAQQIAPAPGHIYKLPLLTDSESFALLCELAPRLVEMDYEDVRELIEGLEGLPLALQVAGRMLRSELEMGWGVADLLRDLRQGARLLEEQAPGALPEVARETSPTVAALLQRSTEGLDEETRLRFALLGVFAPKPAVFDLAALRTVWDIPDPRPTARALVGRGLMEPVGNGRFQIHALLVAHARSLFQP